jgi:hypothetical protein
MSSSAPWVTSRLRESDEKLSFVPCQLRGCAKINFLAPLSRFRDQIQQPFREWTFGVFIPA